MRQVMKLRPLLLGLLVYALFIIVWGAWVRISHSGDGCGDSWPLCAGELIPSESDVKTWREYFHRLTSGIYGLLILLVTFLAHRWSEKGDEIRLATKLLLFFVITESLLGAKLVIFGLVGTNDSFFRALSMSLHLINSLLLMAVSYYAWVVAGAQLRLRRPTRQEWSIITLGASGFFIICMTGAFAALSNTLFPSLSLAQGLAEDLARDAHWLIRARMAHPIAAILIGGAFAMVFYLQVYGQKEESQKGESKDDRAVIRASEESSKSTSQDGEISKSKESNNLKDEREKRGHGIRFLLFAGAILFGLTMLASLSPVWMKLVHLLWTHILSLSLVAWLLHRLRTTPPQDFEKGVL